MTDHPMLFSAPMIRAERARIKTQTRRILTPKNTLFNGRSWTKLQKAQKWDWENAFVDGGPSPAGNPGPYLHLPWLSGNDDPYEGTRHRIYPKIQPGDRIWVKETFALTRTTLDYETGGEQADYDWEEDYGPAQEHLDGDPRFGLASSIYYRADGEDHHPSELYPCIGFRGEIRRPASIPWRPSIFMSRWASRITLLVKQVRIERLQDISAEDAIAEGIERHHSGWMPYSTMFYEEDGITPANYHLDPRESYRSLWNMINGAGAWDENPWVIATTFEVVKTNIDKLPKVGP